MLVYYVSKALCKFEGAMLWEKIISWVKRQDEHRVFWYEFSVYKGVGYGKMKIIQSDFYMSHIHKQRVEYHQIKLSYEDFKKKWLYNFNCV